MFKNELIVKRIIGVKNAWQLKKPLRWEDDKTSSYVEVPKDYIFDFASVPMFFRWFFPRQGRKYDRASCLHDWLYEAEIYSRKKCDDVFLRAMIVEGVSRWRAYAMYYAVRAGGWIVWERHTKESVEKIRELMRSEK